MYQTILFSSTIASVMDFSEITRYKSPKVEYEDYEYPFVSTIIPTFNCAEKIALTLEGVLGQKYPHFEVIVIDGNSTDHTFEVVQHYRDNRIRLYRAAEYGKYEMLNKGMSHAKGEYVNFLFPGDFYIHPRAFLCMMQLALEEEKPKLIYCGTLIRDGRHEPKILSRLLSLRLLERGQQPTSLQSCWWRLETLNQEGKFDTRLKMRGGFDFMCRFFKGKNPSFARNSHILTDYDLRFVSRHMVVEHFVETFWILRRHFGLWIVLRWLFVQKDLSRLLSIWCRQIRTALFGQ